MLVDDVILIPKSTFVSGSGPVTVGFNSIIVGGAGEYQCCFFSICYYL